MHVKRLCVARPNFEGVVLCEHVSVLTTLRIVLTTLRRCHTSGRPPCNTAGQALG